MLTGTENYLLSANPSLDEIASAINKVIELPDEFKRLIRKHNRLKWEQLFSATENNKRLIEELLRL